MEILVLVKPVPDPERYNDITIDPVTKRLMRDGVPSVIDPEGKNALEAALTIRESREKATGSDTRITILAMAPEHCRDKLTECLAMGADEAFLLSDRAFGGADTYATSFVLAEGIKKIERERGIAFDLVLAGNSSADGATSHVPVQTAEWLGIPHISCVCSIETGGGLMRIVRKIEDAFLTFEGSGPAVIAVTRDANKPRLINAMGIIKARKKPLILWSNDDLGLDPEKTGLQGSPTRPGELITPDVSRAAEPLADDPKNAAKAVLQLIRKAGV